MKGGVEEIEEAELRHTHFHLDRRVGYQPLVPADHVGEIGRQELQLALRPKLAEDAIPVGLYVEAGGAREQGHARVLVLACVVHPLR